MSFKEQYTKVIAKGIIVLTQHLLNLLPQLPVPEVDDNLLGLLLLRDALEKTKDQIGLSELNDFSPTKMAYLQKIRDAQLQLSQSLKECGQIGAIHQVSSVEDDLFVAQETKDVDPISFVKLKREKEAHDLSQKMRKHWLGSIHNEEQTYEEWQLERDKMRAQFDELSKDPDYVEFGNNIADFNEAPFFVEEAKSKKTSKRK